MRIVVCDDELPELERICANLKNIFRQEGIQAELHGFSCGEEFLAYTAKVHVDLVFLDICLGDYNGMDAARILRRTNQTCAIIFVTASRDYAIDAFDVTAAHYLLKPASAEKLREALQRTRLLQNQRKTLSLVSDYLHAQIPLDDILYIDIQDRTSFVHLKNQTLVRSHLPLTSIADLLADEPRFIFCQRSALFNADMVRHLDRYSLELIDHTILPIPTKRYAKVQTSYREYLFTKARSSCR